MNLFSDVVRLQAGFTEHYVGAEAQEDDGEPFDEKMKRLTSHLKEQFEESARLEKMIR